MPSAKKADSSRVVPMIIGTSEAAPSATASSGRRGSRPPSTTGFISNPESSVDPPVWPNVATPSTSRSKGTCSNSAAGEHHAEMRSELLRQVGRVVHRRGVWRAALDDHATEETVGLVDPQETGDAHPTRRLAEEGDVVRVATEDVDVLAHPVERGHLVGKTPVPGSGPLLAVEPLLPVLLECGMGEEAECTEAVVDRDEHHIAVACEHPAAVETSRPRAGEERAAVDPDHHRTALGVGGGGPDVEAEAILGDHLGIAAERELDQALRLRGDRTEAIAVADTRPGFRWRRRAPPTLTRRRRRVGYA